MLNYAVQEPVMSALMIMRRNLWTYFHWKESKLLSVCIKESNSTTLYCLNKLRHVIQATFNMIYCLAVFVSRRQKFDLSTKSECERGAAFDFSNCQSVAVKIINEGGICQQSCHCWCLHCLLRFIEFLQSCSFAVCAEILPFVDYSSTGDVKIVHNPPPFETKSRLKPSK